VCVVGRCKLLLCGGCIIRIPTILVDNVSGAQTSSVVSDDLVVIRKTSPVRGILRRRFLRPSSSVGARGCSLELVHPQPSMELWNKGGVGMLGRMGISPPL
jgi:hypothetical protein